MKRDETIVLAEGYVLLILIVVFGIACALSGAAGYQIAMAVCGG